MGGEGPHTAGEQGHAGKDEKKGDDVIDADFKEV
jgi:hypothetical protein